MWINAIDSRICEERTHDRCDCAQWERKHMKKRSHRQSRIVSKLHKIATFRHKILSPKCSKRAPKHILIQNRNIQTHMEASQRLFNRQHGASKWENPYIIYGLPFTLCVCIFWVCVFIFVRFVSALKFIYSWIRTEMNGTRSF